VRAAGGAFAVLAAVLGDARGQHGIGVHGPLDRRARRFGQLTVDVRDQEVVREFHAGTSGTRK
jgi:hypothetical protein